MPKPSDTPPAVLENKTANIFHWVLSCLLAIAFALQIFSLFQPLKFAGLLDAVFMIIATAATMAALWRRLPLQNVLLATAGIALIGGGFSALGAKYGLPFGPFVFGSGSGPLIFKTLAWAMPLIWVVIVLNSRGVARLMLRPWRKNKSYGYRVIGLAAVLALLFDLALEPFAFRVKHLWLWEPTTLPLTWQGAPIMTFVAWGLITLLILLFITPALIVKKPRSKSVPELHALCLWLGGVALCATGCAVAGIWAAVILNVLIGIGVAIFAIRGAMW
ncbi:MAG TPA: carotenoid biosynthesis protein [Candidatus Sulfotelmatobacter sp.]|nr:carotenoid biosynthesis protein [Candidatus Sulfotelmatobacter sp.]